MTHTIRALSTALLLPLLAACSMGQMVARTSVSIMDGNIAAMDRETDLVLATFGRGFYVLDDYTPLRTLKKAENIRMCSILIP